jgi:hypothetical protein
MRSTLRITALILVLVALLIPLAVQASGPCPDDPELSKYCNPETPPFYVVINRSFEDLGRSGSGCQPIILKHPECTDCCGEDVECLAAEDDLQMNVCPLLASRVDWTGEEMRTETVYEMCCDCSESSAGAWKYRIRMLYEDGTCPLAMENVECIDGLPPDTGIDLPAPVIIGGLAIVGAALLAAGVVARRRTLNVV